MFLKKKNSTNSKFPVPGCALLNIILNDTTFPKTSLESDFRAVPLSKNYQLLSLTLPPELDKNYPFPISQQIHYSSGVRS
jgi:hypothetical protein